MSGQHEPTADEVAAAYELIHRAGDYRDDRGSLAPDQERARQHVQKVRDREVHRAHTTDVSAAHRALFTGLVALGQCKTAGAAYAAADHVLDALKAYIAEQNGGI